MFVTRPIPAAAPNTSFETSGTTTAGARLPLLVSLPIVTGLSLMLWIIVWKAAQQTLALLQ